jgi:septum formation topological specificity factor MinE
MKKRANKGMDRLQIIVKHDGMRVSNDFLRKRRKEIEEWFKSRIKKKYF